ncbi:hypothetical protein KCP74_05090 [Salmonella enterica subsp. enterica]|nr:hypothetical protein KCP74_05090 [Salmonella enterica subsp. enterica]
MKNAAPVKGQASKQVWYDGWEAGASPTLCPWCLMRRVYRQWTISTVNGPCASFPEFMRPEGEHKRWNEHLPVHYCT